MAAMLILNIFVCDVVCFFVEKGQHKLWTKLLMKYIFAIPFTVTLTYLLSDWTTIPHSHSIVLGLLIPAIVLIGNYTIQYFETDLGIIKEKMKPGRGLIIDNIKSILYAAPVVFHYIRYFIF